MTNTLPPRRCRIRRIELISALILTLLFSLSWLPRAASAAQDSQSVMDLKEKAQQAYMAGRYAEAEASDLEIAEKHPESEARHYAVQLLGVIYEENLVDLRKAIQWDTEFLEKYADSRQGPVYKEKIAFLENLLPQEAAFRTYQAIRSGKDSDEVRVQKYEALLKECPDFLLKDRVESELGYSYARLDKREKSYRAFQSITSDGGEKKLSSSDLATYKDARRYWQMSWTWAWIAWAAIVVLWAAVLAMKPWRRITRASGKKFLIWPLSWLLLTCACLPLYYKMEITGYPIVIPISTAIIAIGLNLIVLFWLLLLIKGDFWRSRPLALRVFSPILTLAMTIAVFYLFVVYHPQGPYITDVFGVKYVYWKSEWKEHGFSWHIPGH
jgi:hypothetical protein